MNCDECDQAIAEPARYGFADACEGCKARAIAVTTIFHDSIESSQKSPQYRMALAQFFPGKEQEGARLVREWFVRLRDAKRGKVAA